MATESKPDERIYRLLFKDGMLLKTTFTFKEAESIRKQFHQDIPTIVRL